MIENECFGAGPAWSRPILKGMMIEMAIHRRFAENAFENILMDTIYVMAMRRLKAEQTTNCVSALCEEIAKSLKLLPEDRDVAWLIGLLHDVGRFEAAEEILVLLIMLLP